MFLLIKSRTQFCRKNDFSASAKISHLIFSMVIFTFGLKELQIQYNDVLKQISLKYHCDFSIVRNGFQGFAIITPCNLRIVPLVIDI